jgi:hypothetical protein
MVVLSKRTVKALNNSDTFHLTDVNTPGGTSKTVKC